MADRGQQGFAGMDEERHNDVSREGGHASHEKGNAHEFDREEASEAGRRGAQGRHMAHASREMSGSAEGQTVDEGGAEQGGTSGNGGAEAGEEQGRATRQRKTRGGTHDQHVTAGKKGGSRIRQLIELGYKYEEEHGIGPGRNERSKLAAKRRASKSNAQGGEGNQGESGGSAEEAMEGEGD
jgi:uncharacterized protein